MHLYRFSEEQVKNLNNFLDRFITGEVKMSSVKEALMAKNAFDEIKKSLSKECSDEFVLKTKVDTLPEAEAMVEKLQEEKQAKRAK